MQNNKLFYVVGIAIPTLMRLESPTIDAIKSNSRARDSTEYAIVAL